MSLTRKVMFDTNIYIFHSFGYPIILDVFQHYIMEDYSITLSTMQEMELLAYYKIDSNEKLYNQRMKYISMADEIVPVSSPIAQKSAEIMRKWKIDTGKRLKPGDALIAATALVNNATLISNNDRDFTYIKENFGLKYANPIPDQLELKRFMEKIQAEK